MKRIAVLAVLVLPLFGCSLLGNLRSVTWGIVAFGTGEEYEQARSTLQARLSEESGYNVTIVGYTDYESLLGSLEGSNPETDMASLPTFVYLVANERGLAEIAAAGSRYGSTTYAAQVLVRADSGISGLSEIAGKTFLRPDPMSTSGWIIPEILMRAAGVNVDAEVTPLDAGGHAQVVMGLYDGIFDATPVEVGGTYVDARDAVNDPDNYPDVNSVVEVLEVSAPIPNDGVSFHPDVRDAKRTALVEALQLVAGSADADAFRTVTSWDTVVVVDDTFYNDIRQLLTDAGVDPGDYL